MVKNKNAKGDSHVSHINDSCSEDKNSTQIMSQMEIFESLGNIEKVTPQDACRIKATLAYQECAKMKLTEEVAQVKLQLVAVKEDVVQLKSENTRLMTALNQFKSTISSHPCSDSDTISSTVPSFSNSNSSSQLQDSTNLNVSLKSKQDEFYPNSETPKKLIKRINTGEIRFDPSPYPNIINGPRYCRLLKIHPWIEFDSDTNSLQCKWCNWHRNKVIRSFTPTSHMKSTESLNMSFDSQRRQIIAKNFINSLRQHSMGLTHNEALQSYNKIHNTTFEARFGNKRSKDEINAVVKAYKHDHLYCSVSKQSTYTSDDGSDS